MKFCDIIEIIRKGVVALYIQNDLNKIKSGISDNIGNKVKLVIENTYPSIFTVKLDEQNDVPTSRRRVSYSYTDVLTKAVELIVCEPKNTAE